MAFDVTKFKSQLEYGGARPSFFLVSMSLPQALRVDGGEDNGVNAGAMGLDKNLFQTKLEFMCRAASLPASTIASIDVPFFGRQVKVAGSRTFAPWTITVINDEDFAVRSMFEYWVASINGHKSNIRNSGSTASPASYQGTAVVAQYSKGPAELPIRKYRLMNAFPTDVEAIELSWASGDEIEEFTVNLAYDYWETDNGDVVKPIGTKASG